MTFAGEEFAEAVRTHFSKQASERAPPNVSRFQGAKIGEVDEGRRGKIIGESAGGTGPLNKAGR